MLHIQKGRHRRPLPARRAARFRKETKKRSHMLHIQKEAALRPLFACGAYETKLGY